MPSASVRDKISLGRRSLGGWTREAVNHVSAHGRDGPLSPMVKAGLARHRNADTTFDAVFAAVGASKKAPAHQPWA